MDAELEPCRVWPLRRRLDLAAPADLKDSRFAAFWEERGPAFDEALRSTPPGNNGTLGLILMLPEITPVVGGSGKWFIDASGAHIDEASVPAAVAVRSAIEGRFLSMRARGEALGLKQQRHCVSLYE